MLDNVMYCTSITQSIFSISDTAISICCCCFSQIKMLLSLYYAKLLLNPCLSEAPHTRSHLLPFKRNLWREKLLGTWKNWHSAPPKTGISNCAQMTLIIIQPTVTGSVKLTAPINVSFINQFWESFTFSSQPNLFKVIIHEIISKCCLCMDVLCWGLILELSSELPTDLFPTQLFIRKD